MDGADGFLCVFIATFSLTASSGAGEGLPCPYSRDERTEAERVSALPMNTTVGGHEPRPGGPRSKSGVETPAQPGAGPAWASDKLGRHPEPSFCSPVPLALDLVPFPTQTLSPTSRLLNVLLPPPRRPCPFSKLALSLQVSDPWFTDSPQGPSHVPYAVPGAGNPA